MAPLARRLLAEFLGTGLLVAVVIGSGIAAQQLSPTDIGLQLLQNSLTTVFGLGVLILLFGPVSGAHFNPVVSAVDWAIGRRAGTGLTGARPGRLHRRADPRRHRRGACWPTSCSGWPRCRSPSTSAPRPGCGVGEIVATAGLIALILTLARTGRAALSAAAVAAWIGAAYWFTSSTSFANPAVTIARMFSDTFAGIAPASVPLFVVFQSSAPPSARAWPCCSTPTPPPPPMTSSSRTPPTASPPRAERNTR